MTWHDGTIPSDEIWVKIGGDKRGGTFKMNFRSATSPAPILQPTPAFLTFFNVSHQSSHWVGQVQGTDQRSLSYTVELIHYRDKTIRLFLSGDYELLCKRYGFQVARRH